MRKMDLTWNIKIDFDIYWYVYSSRNVDGTEHLILFNSGPVVRYLTLKSA